MWIGIIGKAIDIIKNVFIAVFFIKVGKDKAELDAYEELEKRVTKHKKTADAVKSKSNATKRDSLRSKKHKST
jgi:hypothetical protein